MKLKVKEKIGKEERDAKGNLNTGQDLEKRKKEAQGMCAARISRLAGGAFWVEALSKLLL